MSTHCKDHFVYTLLFSVLVYSGVYFTAGEMSIWSKALAHLLMTANAIVVYHILKSYWGDGLENLLASLLYLASPVHLDSFLFYHQIPFFIAESALIFSLFTYIKARYYVSFSLLVLAAILNNQLILILPLFYFVETRFDKYKIILPLVFLLSLFYNGPLLIQVSILDSIKHAAFWIKNVVFSSTSFLDMGQFVETNILDLWIFGGVFLVVILYLLKANKTKTSLVWALILCWLGSVFIPHHYLTSNETSSLYFNSTDHVFIVWIIIFFLLISLRKQKSLLVTVCSFMIINWTLSTIGGEVFFTNMKTAWGKTMENLPEDFPNEERARFAYVQYLLGVKEYIEAEAFLNSYKFKYKKYNWYVLSKDLAFRRGDEQALINIDKEMQEYRISEEPI